MENIEILKPNEKVLFIGTYNLQNSVLTDSTAAFKLNMNNNNGINIGVIQYNSIKFIIETPILLNEIYNFHSYNINNESIGEIQLTSTYINNVFGIRSYEGLLNLNINSSNGIYKIISRVVFDTRQNDRKIYFICNKNII
jgi:hypothetical protein